MPFDLGATARLTAECRDPGGTLTTAGTATVTITLPDGTSVSPSATETTPLGTYTADYVTAQPGRHTVRWVFTSPAHAYTDSFDVAPAQSTALLSLADAKRHLNLTSATDDDEVRAWIGATTEAVEWFVGPVVPRTVVEDHTATSPGVLALRQVPVLELTSVAGILTGATGYEVDTLSLDGASGIVRRLDGATLAGPLRVTYEAGRRIVPPVITAAARIILQHLWRTQQGPGRPQLGVGDFDVTEPIPGLGYAIPNRAMQLLSPYQLPPGVA
jgi:hypothetical protein